MSSCHLNCINGMNPSKEKDSKCHTPQNHRSSLLVLIFIAHAPTCFSSILVNRIGIASTLSWSKWNQFYFIRRNVSLLKHCSSPVNWWKIVDAGYWKNEKKIPIIPSQIFRNFNPISRSAPKGPFDDARAKSVANEYRNEIDTHRTNPAQPTTRLNLSAHGTVNKRTIDDNTSRHDH